MEALLHLSSPALYPRQYGFPSGTLHVPAGRTYHSSGASGPTNLPLCVESLGEPVAR